MTIDEARDRMRSALELDRAGRLDEAAAICGELLAARPGQPHALCLLGRVRRRQGRLDEAQASLSQAHSLAPGLNQVRAELGFLALSRNDARAAIEHFSALVAHKPDDADAHYNLACALEMAGLFRESADHLERALALHPAAPHEILARLGAARLMMSEEPQAAAHFDAALALDAAHAPALYGMGMVHSGRGEFEQAGEMFRRAIAADPDFVDAYQQLAVIRRFEAADDPDLALLRARFERADPSGIAREKLAFALGKACDDLGDYEQAFSLYTEANTLKRARVPGFDRAAHRALVDRTIDIFSAEFFAQRAGRGSPSRTPVLIFGMPRSGTTLVEQMLSSHSRVAAAGEQIHFERLSRSFGDRWPDAVRDWDTERIQQTARTYLELLDRQAQARDRITDKMPANFLHAGLVHLLFPEAALLHCRRDPVDTCLSIYFLDFGIGNFYANDLDDIAFYYREYERLMRHWRTVLTFLDIDYAALVTEPERVMREAVAFCGLEWEEGCLEFAGNRRAVATPSRWQVRQPIYTHSLGRRDSYAPYIGALEAALAE